MVNFTTISFVKLIIYHYFLYKQQLIHMANGSYSYLMEYTCKTYNKTHEKSRKTTNTDVATEEAYGDEEEQGTWHYILAQVCLSNTYHRLALKLQNITVEQE